MRLFVATAPPATVLDHVAEVVSAWPERAGVRRTSREQWHTTLRFLGEVDDPSPVIAALSSAALPAADAELGPATRMLGRQVVCLPVSGLEDLAAAVSAATAPFGPPPDDRPFRGHLTLARLKRGTRPRDIRDLVGCPILAAWRVEDVALVRSHLSSVGPTYETLQAIAIDEIGGQRRRS